MCICVCGYLPMKHTFIGHIIYTTFYVNFLCNIFLMNVIVDFTFREYLFKIPFKLFWSRV